MGLYVRKAGGFSRDVRELDVDTTGQVCSVCRQHKPWSEFIQVGKTARHGSWCRSCKKLNDQKTLKNNPSTPLIYDAKRRAKARGLPFDLDDYREQLDAKIRNGCELTGLPFRIGTSGDNRRYIDRPSFDRIKAEKGYTFANVRVVWWGMNAALGEWGEEGLETMMRAWIEKKDAGYA